MEIKGTVEPKHGHVISPQTRGAIAVRLGLMEDWQSYEMEGGKNFPALLGGQFPSPYQEDSQSNMPPVDGYILSGGKGDGRDSVNFTDAEMRAKLEAIGIPDDTFKWTEIAVSPGQIFEVKWDYHAAHVTRGYRWFITKNNWRPEERITRAQLEETPFFEDFYTEVPFYQHSNTLVAKIDHNVTLPMGKTGHHVIVLAWIVADTGAAFFQAFDVNFGN